jgi:cellulose synthase/poly-beta-1,6-N-acetylglucosamine synthase-like glycosyltransferase
VAGYDNQLWSEVDGSEPIPLHETTFGSSEWTLGSIDRTSSRLLLSGFPMLKLVVRRSTFDAVGGFRAIYAVEDFDILWRLIAHGERVQLLREPTGNYLVRSTSTTSTVQLSRRAWERAQRSWLKVWGGMALSNGLPLGVRSACLRSFLWTAARLAFGVVRRAKHFHNG